MGSVPESKAQATQKFEDGVQRPPRLRYATRECDGRRSPRQAGPEAVPAYVGTRKPYIILSSTGRLKHVHIYLLC